MTVDAACDIFSGSSSEELAAGQVVAGTYRVLSLIARGGMGNVYLVEHIYLLKTFAMKVLPAYLAGAEASRRFLAEARSIARLEHENIVKIHNFGLTDAGVSFYVMELVDGLCLEDWLLLNGPLTIEQTLNLMHCLCRGLAYAHGRGFVHRDIKPANVMVDFRGACPRVKLLDFGLVQCSQNATGQERCFGSPLYMSPEQCEGLSVDRRTDVYSLGCLLYACLTGVPPFMGSNPLATCYMHTNGARPVLRQEQLREPVDADTLHKLNQILQFLLSVRREERYRDMDEVLLDLSLIGAEPEPEEPTGPETISEEKVFTGWLVAFLCVLGTTSVLLSLWFSLQCFEGARAESRRQKVDSSVAALVDSTAALERNELDIQEMEDLKPFMDGSGKFRHFAFPRTACLGILRAADDANFLMKAQGELTFPGQSPLIFHPSAACLNKPRYLRRFSSGQLEGIYAAGNELLDDDNLRYSDHLKDLKYLNCHFTRLSDASLTTIAKFDQLQFLDVSHTLISHLESLPNLRNLKTLYMDSLPGLPAVLKELRKTSVIEALDISDISIAASDVELLKGLKKLRRLNLHGSKIDPERLPALLDSLSNLSYLDLSANELSDAQVERLLPALKRSHLRILLLSKDGLSEARRHRIESNLPDACRVNYETVIENAGMSELISGLGKF